MSIAFDNTDLEAKLCNSCSCKGFVPKLKYEVDLKAETVKLTDASVFDTGDKLEKIVIHIYDKEGKKGSSSISIAGGSVALSITGFNYTDISITATIVSVGGCKGDVAQYHIGQYALTGYLQHLTTNA